MKPSLACGRYRVGWGIALCSCAFLWGCVGATRLPTRASGPAGATVEKKEISLGFLQMGSTHREEVVNHLSEIDTAYSNPRLFWGRWNESRWGYWWVLAAPCSGNCATGDAKRIWHVQNVLVAFDEDGLVTSQETIRNDDSLWRALHARMLESAPPPLDLSQPIRLSLATREPEAILLGKNGLEFERSKSGKANVQISAQQVIRFSHRGTRDKRTSPGVTCHALELSEKTVFGKKIKFCAEAAQVGILFQYLQQAGSPGLNWQ